MLKQLVASEKLMFPGVAIYWETLRHLRPIQLYGRIWHKFFQAPIDQAPAPLVNHYDGLWTDPVTRPVSMRGPLQFHFLNHLHSLPDSGGWEEDRLGELWRYNLHYFDDLNAENARERTQWHRHLISRWIDENKPGKGTGWEPYPTSLRIVNWIKWALAGNVLDSEYLHSLAIQTRWLCRRVEWHLLGNHLFANAKALIFAGAFFKGSEADDWVKTGLRILGREIPEQVLEDGGHFELSTMYHAIILEDILDIINLSRTFQEKIPVQIVTSWKREATKMTRWIKVMSNADGEVTFFNDTARGISGNRDELRQYAERLEVQVPKMNKSNQIHLKSSGYFRWEKSGAVLIGDVGKVGPDYLPAHAHADTLSFEYSLGGQQVLVNSGTSLYEANEERLRQRGTSAHNTVEIEKKNSSEVWKSFRVARRAKPFDLVIKKQNDEWFEIGCSHDGYKRLSGRNIHRRKWRLRTKQLEILDEIQGAFHSAVARFYLHPEVTVQKHTLYLPAGDIVKLAVHGGRINVVKSTWHPEFGMAIESRCIEAIFEKSEMRVTFLWE